MTVRLALYKGNGGPANAAIRWWTGSTYSHCELVIDGVSYSSSLMDGGVRGKVIEFKSAHWDFIELPWADPQRVLDYFAATDADRYGLAGLLVNQVFNRNQRTPHAQFCSEWCARALGIPSGSVYNPATLGELCAWLGDKSPALQTSPGYRGPSVAQVHPASAAG